MKTLRSDEVIEAIQDDAILVLHGEGEEIKYAIQAAIQEAEKGQWATSYATLKRIDDSLTRCLNVVQPWGNPPSEEGDYEQADRY